MRKMLPSWASWPELKRWWLQRRRGLWMYWTTDEDNSSLERLTHTRGDILYVWGDECSKKDGAYLHSVFGVQHMNLDKTFGPSVLEELHNRGYDLTTIRFSIKRRIPR